MCTGCFEKLNVAQGLIYQIQLVRGTGNKVRFTTKLGNSDYSPETKILGIYEYVGIPCTFQKIALKDIENYI